MIAESNLLEESVFGDYRIIRKIGKSAWSENFLVEHRFIKKKYVLHLLESRFSEDSQFMSSFENYIVNIALLDHPCIFKIKNVSENNGSYFIVTEFFEEKTQTLSISQYLFGKQDFLSEEEVVAIVSQVADALDYAHDHNVLNVCLFPESIFIDKSNANVMLTDFGIRDLFIRFSLLSYLDNKEDSLFFRSIAFLSPEKKAGTICDERSDVYTFGVLVYFLLFKEIPEGIFTMPSERFPDYVYDWDELLRNCLSYDLNSRARKLGSLLKKKAQNTETKEKVQIMVQKAKSSEDLRDFSSRLDIDDTFQEKIASFSVSEKLREERTSEALYYSEARMTESQKFVLVSPCSIDASIIEVSADPVNQQSREKKGHASEQETKNHEYSKALHAMLNKDPIVSTYHLKKNIEHTPEPLLTETVLIQGGSFYRGSNSGNRDEAPKHLINLNSFFMDIHPVTNEQYLRFLDFIGGEQDQHCNDLIRLRESRIQRKAGMLLIEPGYGKHPVVGVTWYGAVSYASWVGKRLPTEAEWEIASRGGRESESFPTGNKIDKTQANFFSSDTTAVMTYPCNGYGLYDMVGNVYEWCNDWYDYNYYELSSQEPLNPKGPVQGVYRVLRGGCWKSLILDLCCSHRHRNNPGTVNSTYGFRCALDVR